MKKDKKENTATTRQTAKGSKGDLPVKNKQTNSTKNTATQTRGLNEAKTTRDDLFPSDGDNLTV